MIWVICKWLIYSGAKVAANHDSRLLMYFTPTNCRAATSFQMHPSMGHMQKTLTGLEDLLLPVLQPTIPLCGWPAYPQMLTRLRAQTCGPSVQIIYSLIPIKILRIYDP
ncbi:hypothetical protein O181_014206 [Austropuccinia psidii MF-1]|uniref:Uncharacterized protein n=1 Tax=Austropuccinia psidii MF-1 TaxID=1389203 RepID=A0A9Q3GNY3_9BASI|nr:hypothetical protein [Austropuccinia psidii MF-1]